MVTVQPGAEGGPTNGIRVIVDRARCLGSSACVFEEPAVFDQDPDEGLVVLLEEFPPRSRLQTVRHAADACPAQAIRVEISAEVS